ncbi:MAG: phosphatase PAP2 family protein [Eubacterium sp.]|nr:phosphatase PAP2 family protein [Eubacterium sp.]
MKKGKIMSAVICTILFAVLIVLVKTVDVQQIGPEGTSIGFAGINKAMNEATGLNMTLYKITEVLGLLALAVAGCFALLGLVQLIKRKSFAKVDPEIYALAGLYVVVLMLYVIFEKVIINYRPVIMPDEEHVEASFPSSHTMLGFVIMGSTFIVIDKYIKNESICRLIRIVSILILIAIVFGRLFSGVHWLTDILGGVLISSALLFIFSAVIGALNKNKGSGSDE